jgi:hypothetical protein
MGMRRVGVQCRGLSCFREAIAGVVRLMLRCNVDTCQEERMGGMRRGTSKSRHHQVKKRI